MGHVVVFRKIALSRAAHVRKTWKDFCGYRLGEIASIDKAPPMRVFLNFTASGNVHRTHKMSLY